VKIYKAVSLLLCIIFAIVGLLFLFLPDGVISFFNTLSNSFGMPVMPVEGTGFYTLLATGYMYLVTVLAFMMFRKPEVSYFPLILIHGKFATSILSLALFIFHNQYLIYITNFIVDGIIGIIVLIFYLNLKKILS